MNVLDSKLCGGALKGYGCGVANENSTLGKLSKERSDISAIFNEDTTLIKEIDKTDSLVSNLHQQKSILDTLLIHCENENDSSTNIKQSAEILTEIHSHIRYLNELTNELTTARQAKIDTALNRNNRISTATDIEENERAMNGIFLDKLVYGTFNLDSTQLATLDYIAPQCPYSGGRVVLIARVIKEALGDTTVYNDSLLCAGLGSPRLSNKKKENTNLFLFVYPNPSNDVCTFNYKLPEDLSGTIEFYNLLGKKIETINVKSNSKSMVFKTEHLVDGIYLIRLVANETVSGIVKMTIIR